MVKATIAKTTKVKKNFRQYKNPNQTSEVQIYFDQDHHAINVPKDGYCFSLDKEMDKSIEFLKKEYGFVEVK